MSVGQQVADAGGENRPPGLELRPATHQAAVVPRHQGRAVGAVDHGVATGAIHVGDDRCAEEVEALHLLGEPGQRRAGQRVVPALVVLDRTAAAVQQQRRANTCTTGTRLRVTEGRRQPDVAEGT